MAMSELTTQRLQTWLQPPEHELVGLATSQAEFNYLQEHVYRVRREFILQSATQIMLEKSLGTPESDEAVFAALPARNYMTRDDHRVICNIARDIHGQGLQKAEALRYWNELTELQAVLDGFTYTRTKYDDSHYRSEAAFDEALNIANEVRDSGYPVRFFMRGVKYMGQAALDIESMRNWVTGQSEFEPEVYQDKWRRQQRPARQFTASHPSNVHHVIDWGFVRDHMSYWDAVIAAKDIGDQYVPWLRKRQTFGDCVEVIAPGVYLAPYIPEEVTSTGNYIDYDDVYRAALRGRQTAIAATHAFHDVVCVAINLQTEGWGPANNISSERLRVSANNAQPGVIFMHRQTVIKAAQYIEVTHKNRHAVRAICGALVNRPTDSLDLGNELDQRLLQ